jgi:hypothetical protein
MAILRGCIEGPTLKLTNILNAGTVHEGTPSSDFSIFDPYMLFLAFFCKIGIYDRDLY